MMKVPARTIERAEELIRRGEDLLRSINQPGNIDAHDMWYAEARSFIDLIAPSLSKNLAAVAKKYGDALFEKHNGRAVYNLILDQTQVIRLACDGLRQTDDTTSIRLGDLYAECKGADGSSLFHEELITCIFELKSCYDNECYTASIGLCGKILEISLKRFFTREGIAYQPKDMLGTLIAIYRTKKGVDFAHKHIAESSTIINDHRIGAVHAKEQATAPTHDQAVMVIHCTADILAKTKQ